MTNKLITLIIFLFVTLIAGIIAFSPHKEANEQGDVNEQEFVLTEEQLINDWIKGNNLNMYGDPIDTVYAGGTPLFDEEMGESIDRLEYVISKHPDKPWNKK